MIYSAVPNWTGTIGSGGVADGTVTTIPLSSAVGLTDGDYYILTIDRVDANGVLTPAKKEVVAGQLSGTNLINCIRGVEGTAQAHAAGAVVEMLFTAKHWNDLKAFVEGLNTSVENLNTFFQTEHNADGTHLKATGAEVNAGTDDTKIVTPKAIGDSNVVMTDKPQTLTNKTLVFPIIRDFDGWIDANENWVFASASDPNFNIIVSGDKTSKYSKGMKVKLTQSTGGVKYFIITNVSYSNPNTTITLYGGTDYDLVNEAISNNYYSVSKSPVGFPSDLTKWTIFQAIQSSNVNSSNNTIVDITGASLTLPAGTYKINAHFFGRAWTNPETGEPNLYMYGDIYNQTNSAIITSSGKALKGPGFVPKDIFLDFTTIQTFTSLTTIKLRGYVNLFGYTNVASGFRADSSPANLEKCRIIAERIDLSI